MILKDKVIVLKHIRFGESDLILRVLNQKGALISFIAKGALKSKKRFMGGVLDPGNFIGVEYKKSRSSTLHFLCQAWFLKAFEGLRSHYDCLKMAFYFLSVIDKVSQEGVEDSPDLFNLLGNGLTALEQTALETTTLEKRSYLSALQFMFEFRLLLVQGVLPSELQKYKEISSLTLADHKKLEHILPNFKDLMALPHQAVEHYMNSHHP